MKEIRKYIGYRVREIREAKGMTQDDLANKTGLKQSNISVIEAAKNNIRIDTLHKIADALGVAVELITKH